MEGPLTRSETTQKREQFLLEVRGRIMEKEESDTLDLGCLDAGQVEI